MQQQQYDSLIFDMDGTLWDAVDSYVTVWNVTSGELGVSRPVTRDDLLRLMGKTIDVIFNSLMQGIDIDADAYLKRLDYNESTLMPKLGGTLYPGVTDGLKALKQHYRLFMVSNCGADGLQNMLRYTHLEPLIEGTLTHGETGKGKDFNIKQIIKNYNLSKSLYIGDTQSDCTAAHAAGIDMCHARWGFGSATDPELSFPSFDDMTRYLIKAKNQPPRQAHETVIVT